MRAAVSKELSCPPVVVSRQPGACRARRLRARLLQMAEDLSQLTDEQIVARRQGGQSNPADCLAEIDKRHGPMLLRLAARLVGEREGKDVVQKTFLRAFERIDQLDPKEGSFKTWIIRICVSLPTDQQIIAGWQTGDSCPDDCCAEIEKRHRPMLLRLAFRLVGEQGEEIVQETFLRAWKKIDHFDPSRGSFKTWMIRICVNLAITELRRRKRQPESQMPVDLDSGAILEFADPNGKSQEELEAERQDRLIVRECLQSLDDLYVRVLSLLKPFGESTLVEAFEDELIKQAWTRQQVEEGYENVGERMKRLTPRAKSSFVDRLKRTAYDLMLQEMALRDCCPRIVHPHELTFEVSADKVPHVQKVKVLLSPGATWALRDDAHRPAWLELTPHYDSNEVSVAIHVSKAHLGTHTTRFGVVATDGGPEKSSVTVALNVTTVAFAANPAGLGVIVADGGGRRTAGTVRVKLEHANSHGEPAGKDTL